MSVLRFVKWIDQGKANSIVWRRNTVERFYTYIDDIAQGTIAAAQLFI